MISRKDFGNTSSHRLTLVVSSFELMKKVMRKVIILVAVIFIFIFSTRNIKAECDQKCLSDKINQYTQKTIELQTAADTLLNQIAQFDTQIKLTELKIQQTQDQIDLLSGRIGQVTTSLRDLTNAFSARVVATYKMTRSDDPIYFLLSAENLADAVSKFRYLEEAQNSDQALLIRLKTAQESYEASRKQSEYLQNQLQKEQTTLGYQKIAKTQLLTVTKNDEKKYQQLLSQAQAELIAISSITSGQGQEIEIGRVTEGQRIAAIIPGTSACSTGGHLHFEVRNGSSLQDPGSLLKLIYFSYSYSSSEYSYYGTVNPSGSWNWPLNEPITVNQGYGAHGFAKTFYSNGIHTGIDMENANNDLSVKTVRNGVLFKGGISCGGGTLRYVRVHQDDNLDVYYLHVL